MAVPCLASLNHNALSRRSCYLLPLGRFKRVLFEVQAATRDFYSFNKFIHRIGALCLSLSLFYVSFYLLRHLLMRDFIIILWNMGKKVGIEWKGFERKPYVAMWRRQFFLIHKIMCLWIIVRRRALEAVNFTAAYAASTSALQHPPKCICVYCFTGSYPTHLFGSVCYSQPLPLPHPKPWLEVISITRKSFWYPRKSTKLQNVLFLWRKAHLSLRKGFCAPSLGANPCFCVGMQCRFFPLFFLSFRFFFLISDLQIFCSLSCLFSRTWTASAFCGE